MDDPQSLLEGPPEEKNRKFPPLYRKDLHLSSALMGGEVDYIIHNILGGKKKYLWEDHKAVAEIILNNNIGSYRDFIRIVWSSTPELSNSCFKEDAAIFKRELRISLSTLNVGLHNWMQRAGPHQLNFPSMPVVGDDIINYMMTQEIVKWHYYSRVNQVNIRRVSHQLKYKASLTVNGCQLECLGDLVVLSHNKPIQHKVIAPYIAALAVAGMASSRYCTLAYARLADYWGKYPSKSLYQKTLEFFRAADHDLSTLGEEIYSVMKCLPSLAIGAVLKHTELKIPSSFLETVLEDLPASSKLTALFSTKILSTEDAHIRLELSGLWKTMGHPFINVTSSVEELRKKGTSPAVPTAAEGGRDLAAFFRKYWCSAYYKKHKRWPPIENWHEMPAYLRTEYLNNTWGEAGFNSWSYKDFAAISFQPHLDFDYTIDTSELLSDKAMIHSRSQWGYTYNPTAHKLLYGKQMSRPPKKNQRVILEYLARADVSLKEVISSIEQGTMPKEWFAMVGVFKECELKRDKGRLFGKLTFEARLYQTATEHNLADRVFPYIRGQSMTMGEEELKRTILRMSSSLKAYAEHDLIFISVDLSQWCTTWRHESAGPLLQVFDELFGLNGVYALTHLYAQVSGVLIQNKFWPPEQGSDGEPKEGPSYITGFKAWLEGLRQKGWTVGTMMIIEKTAIEYGTNATLLGQGDNQVIVLRHPSHRQLLAKGLTVQKWADGFLSLLEKNMANIGLVLKPKESWISTSLFEYSREYHIGGCPVSRGLKLSSKLLSAPNSQIPTFNTVISSLYASGSGLAGADQTPLMAYFLTTTIAQQHLAMHLHPRFIEDEQAMTVLLSIGRTVGGLPIVPFSGFCYRGMLDSLSVSLSILKTLEDLGYGPQANKLVNLLERVPSPDPLLLVQDPESLPLFTAVQPENYLRNIISQRLTTFVNNKQLKPLFTDRAKEQERLLASDLLRIQPCHPRLANLLYSLSNSGLRQRLIGQFSNTTSMQTLILQERSPIDLHRHLEELDKQTFRLLEARLNQSRAPSSIRAQCLLREDEGWCSAVAAQRLRSYHWVGYQITGVTMAAPQEQTLLTRFEDLPLQATKDTILAKVEGSLTLPHLSRGKFRPYFGSKTSEKVKRGTLQIVDVDKQIIALRKLLTLRPWIKSDTDINLKTLIEILIKEKTAIPIDDLVLIQDFRISGKVDHRVNNPTTPRGSMINSLLAFPSHVFMTTDSATNQTRGGQDWSICYQTVFVSILSRLEILHRFGTMVEGVWGAWTDCRGCTRPVNDHSFHLPSSPQYRGISLVRKISELTVILPHRLKPGNIDGRHGLEVHYGRRLAFKFMSCLAPAGGGYQSMPSFSDLNITELARIDMSTVLKYTRIFLDALHPGCLQALRSDLMLCLQNSQLVLDGIVHALTIAGKLGDIYRLASTQPGSVLAADLEPRSASLSSDRLAVLTSLLSIKDLSDKTFYRDHLFVTPDDTSSTVVKMALLAALESESPNLLRRCHEVLRQLQQEPLTPSKAIELLPPSCRPLVVSDEAVCCLQIREEPSLTVRTRVTAHASVVPLKDPGASNLICKQARPKMQHLQIACTAGRNTLTSEMLWLLQNCDDLAVLLQSTEILTVSEAPSGPCSLALWHYFRRQMQTVSNQGTGEALMLERLIGTGPEDYMGDGCDIIYDRELWITSLVRPIELIKHTCDLLVITDIKSFQPENFGRYNCSYVLLRVTTSDEIKLMGGRVLRQMPCPISPSSSTWVLLTREDDTQESFYPEAFSYSWNAVRRDTQTLLSNCRHLWLNSNRFSSCLNHVANVASGLGLELGSRVRLLRSLSNGMLAIQQAIFDMSYERIRWRALDETHWTCGASRVASVRRHMEVWNVYRFLLLYAQGHITLNTLDSYSCACHCHVRGGRLALCFSDCGDEVRVCPVTVTANFLVSNYGRVVWPLLPILS
ncbi:L protein [Jeremy Point nyavirus]|uniref:RNA-directed RNA polymerase n=1 Tax=Jeremy Point nyavirus TaxID=2652327 RepID=A0AAE6NT96_9MONO|nr:L protein [Jeremy Point nyavirus]QFG01733.1 L protein [Jeremy Point nyavirus]